MCETNTLVVMHASDSGYSRFANEWEGSGEFLPFQPTPFRSYWNVSRNPAEDAVAAFACHGALTRFPDLRVAMVENGTSWVPRLFEALSETHKKMPQLYGENPVDAIQRCIYLNPFWEENLAELSELMPVDHLFFGSDYPHPEGLAEPLSYAGEHHGLPKPDTQISMVMGDNLDRLMRA